MGGRAGGNASGGMGARSGRSTYVATVMVQNQDNMHQLSKSFSKLTKAQDWVDKVGQKFNGFNKTGFATYGSVDKKSKSGATEYDVVRPIDFASIFAKADAKAFKSGYK